MKIAALVKDGKVVNRIVLAEDAEYTAPDGCEVVFDDLNKCKINDDYDGKDFVHRYKDETGIDKVEKISGRKRPEKVKEENLDL